MKKMKLSLQLPGPAASPGLRVSVQRLVREDDRVGYGISVVEGHRPSCGHRQRAWRGASRRKRHPTRHGGARHPEVGSEVISWRSGLGYPIDRWYLGAAVLRGGPSS